MRWFILIVFVVWGEITFSQKKKLIFECSFETPGDLIKWTSQEKAFPGSIVISDSIARSGRNSVRFQLSKTDPIVANAKRSELVFKNNERLKVERWYTFSNFLPSDYTEDNDPDIVAQWHEIPDFALGEGWRAPPIALRIQDGRWLLYVKWAKAKVNTDKLLSGEKCYDLGRYEIDRWTDWVFHIKFSWKRTGILEVWKDGKLVVSRTGPNCYNDFFSPYFKIGIYKWGWSPLKVKPTSTAVRRVIFFDEVKIGNSKVSYSDISINKSTSDNENEQLKKLKE